MADEHVERLLITPDISELHTLLESLPVKPGTLHAATVLTVGDAAITLTLEGGVAGTVERADLDEIPAVGESVQAYVERVDDAGAVHLSLSKATRLAQWDQIEAALRSGDLFEAEVVAIHRGDAVVSLWGLKAICPRRQLVLEPGADPVSLIGQTLPFHVARFDAKKARITLSQDVPDAEPLPDAELPIEVDQVRTGRVKRLTDFGAFVSLGTLDGLLPVSEMSWGRVEHPSEMLSPGDMVEVKVLRYDAEKGKVRLGLKQLAADPWADAADRLEPGTRLTGTVIGVTDFGAFVEVEPGIEGLVHVSELSWTKRIRHPKEVLSVGDRAELVVIRVDADKHKLGLSLKQAAANPYADLRDRFPTGTRVQGTVRNVTDFGVFVGIAEGIDGLVHRTELVWHDSPDPRDLYRKGQAVEAMVLDIDPGRQRISLGFKQLLADEGDARVGGVSEGAEVAVVIKRIVDFGVFAALDTGAEGLIHRSELFEPVSDAHEAGLTVGQQLMARVLSLDPEQGRIGLSLRGVEQPAAEAPEPATEAEPASTEGW